MDNSLRSRRSRLQAERLARNNVPHAMGKHVDMLVSVDVVQMMQEPTERRRRVPGPLFAGIEVLPVEEYIRVAICVNPASGPAEQAETALVTLPIQPLVSSLRKIGHLPRLH